MKRASLPTIVLVLAIGLVALLGYGVVARSPDTSLDEAVQRGERPPAPGSSRSLARLDGIGQLTLGDFRGQVVVLNFWASWCGPCEAEAPALEQIHRSLTAGKTGTVLGASYNDTPTDSRKFVRRFGLTFPIVRDVGTKLAQDYGTRNLPETFVIDREGRVAAVARGQASEAFLRKAVARAAR